MNIIQLGHVSGKLQFMKIKLNCWLFSIENDYQPMYFLIGIWKKIKYKSDIRFV